MARFIVFAFCLGMLAANANAVDPTDQERIDQAYARLRAKQRTSTQPSTGPAAGSQVATRPIEKKPEPNSEVTLTGCYLVDIQTLRKLAANSTDENFKELVAKAKFPSVGLFVKELISGGPAGKAGLKEGDILVSIAGVPTPTLQSLDKLNSLSLRAGQTYKIVFRRLDEEKMIWQPAKSVVAIAARKDQFPEYDKSPELVAGLTNTYDRFADERTIETQDIPVEVTKGHSENGLLPELTVKFSATFKGREISGQLQKLQLSLASFSDQFQFQDSGRVILLVDGVRMNFPAKSVGLGGGTGGILWVSLDAGALRTISGAKQVEAQMGITEFKLSKAQIEEIASFYKAIGQPTAAPKPKADPTSDPKRV